MFSTTTLRKNKRKPSWQRKIKQGKYRRLSVWSTKWQTDRAAAMPKSGRTAVAVNLVGEPITFLKLWFAPFVFAFLLFVHLRVTGYKRGDQKMGGLPTCSNWHGHQNPCVPRRLEAVCCNFCSFHAFRAARCRKNQLHQNCTICAAVALPHAMKCKAKMKEFAMHTRTIKA